jgi:hypothetical protein
MNMRDYPTLHVDINSSKLRKDMDLNEQERLSNITLKTQIKIRKDMDLYEHERLSNITLRHKLK